MWPRAFVTARSHPFREHKGEGTSRNVPLIAATQQVAKVAAILA